MIIGVPKEIKVQENRVGMTPAGIDTFVNAGHTCIVQKSAGMGSNFTDDEYVEAGAHIVDTAQEVYDAAELIIKVKEPLSSEYGFLKENQILFTYLHLAPDLPQTQALLAAKIIGIAYETVQLPDGSLPLLAPMSEVAGRMSVQVGAHLLERVNGGRGILLGGVPGVEHGKVVIVGGGTVGLNALKMAVGMGAQVTVIDINAARLAYIDDLFGGRIMTLMSNNYNIGKAVKGADLVIGAVLIPGARTPKLVTEEMVKSMKPGAVLVDVAVDQGGCIATCDRVTTLEEASYIKHGVVHYAVGNMPGAVPRTSTTALTNATLPYALKIANKGAEKAMQEDPALRKGLNVYKGKLTIEAVAQSQGLEYTPSETLF